MLGSGKGGYQFLLEGLVLTNVDYFATSAQCCFVIQDNKWIKEHLHDIIHFFIYLKPISLPLLKDISNFLKLHAVFLPCLWYLSNLSFKNTFIKYDFHAVWYFWDYSQL